MLDAIAIVAGVLGIGIAVLLVYAATKPHSFRVERTESIKAPPEKVFSLINDLHRWEAWSPYERKDPAMRRTYGGAASGKGATYAWEGNKNVGKGSMEIVESSPPSKVAAKLHFVKPFEARNTAEFTLSARGDTTDVTWTIYGPQPFLAKVMGTFIDMDRMIGADFAIGLANLKRVAEGQPSERRVVAPVT
jgi:uncharacterized protein YndB with AHSA1/START domain